MTCCCIAHRICSGFRLTVCLKVVWRLLLEQTTQPKTNRKAQLSCLYMPANSHFSVCFLSLHRRTNSNSNIAMTAIAIPATMSPITIPELVFDPSSVTCSGVVVVVVETVTVACSVVVVVVVETISVFVQRALSSARRSVVVLHLCHGFFHKHFEFWKKLHSLKYSSSLDQTRSRRRMIVCSSHTTVSTDNTMYNYMGLFGIGWVLLRYCIVQGQSLSRTNLLKNKELHTVIY